VTTLNFEPFVTPETAAQHLAMKRRRVLDMARAGEIPGHPFRTGKKQKRKVWRFKLSELDAAAKVKEEVPEVPARTNRFVHRGR